jgi:dihydrolipoamide dehydrogenase
MDIQKCDVAVIGSGPGGYVSAIRASQLGLKTICIERAELGGICLNWGCIPTKALLKNAEYMNFIKSASSFGFEIKEFSFDFSKVIQRSRDVAKKMSSGIGFLFKKYKVQAVFGNAYIKNKNLIEVYEDNGKVISQIECKHIIIATGARPKMISGIEVDGERIITSKEALVLPSVPQTMIIMGAGAIGVEFAYFYNAYGSDVTLIEMLDRVLQIEDVDVSKELERSFRKSKIKLLTKTKVLSAKKIGNSVEVRIQKSDESEETLHADIALNAIGIQANLEQNGFEGLGIQIERGFIKVNEYMQTSVDGIYAIGDIAGPPWLAHKASFEGLLAAEHIAGHKPQPIDYKKIPSCTYCIPQVASIGLTEAKAIEQGYDVKIGKFPFTASGKAHGIGEATGFVKLVFDAKYGELLGAHLIGPEVTELIGEIAVALSHEATATSIMKTIHAHPTLSEAIMEASSQALGEAVNI